MRYLEELIASTVGAVRPSEKLSVSEWASKYRYLNNPGSFVGYWDHDKTPYMREPMDMLASLNVTAVVFAGPARTGKALALDTPIPTPTGWTTMGKIRVGDQLYDEHGKVCRVTFATEVMEDHNCYRIGFDDKTHIVADAGHKWFVHDIYGAKHRPYGEKVLTTEQMVKKYRIPKGDRYRSRYAIPLAGPIERPDREMLINPYVLGVWLGDGGNHTGYLNLNTDASDEIMMRINSETGMKVHSHPHKSVGKSVSCAVHSHDGTAIKKLLSKLGLGSDGEGKFIPRDYLNASEHQRRELLKGLMDTDGSVDPRSSTCEILTVFPKLAEGISELLTSLSIKHTTVEKETHYRKNDVRHRCQNAFRITFTHHQADEVFTLSYHKERFNTSRKQKVSQVKRRWIRSIEPVASVPVRCISVDSPNHLFLAGEGMIPTHNTDIFMNWLGHVAHTDASDMIAYQMTNSIASEWSQRDLAQTFRAKPPGQRKSVFQQMLMGGKQNIYDKRFNNGMQLLIRWPSITELSGKTIQRAALFDYDRMDQNVENQGNPFDLARKRTTTYKRFGMTYAEGSPGFEITEPNWIASSPHEAPPTKGILELYNRGDRRRWYWRCPDCEGAFEPTFDLLDYPDEGDFMARAEQATLVCPLCGVTHTPDRKYDMNRNGKWLREGEKWNDDGSVSGTPRRSDIASFWMNGAAAGFQDWTGLVLGYLQAMEAYENTGDTGPLKKTMNTDQGIPFEKPKDASERLPEDLKSRAEDWGGGRTYDDRDPTVPEWVRFLVATIDVQARAFVVQITGIGPGGDLTVIDMFKIRKSDRVDENDVRRERANIDPAGYQEDWEVITEQVIERTYPLADGSGRRMAIKITGCDSGGRAGVSVNAYNYWRSLRDDPEGRAHHRRFHLIKGEPSKSAPRRATKRPDSSRKDRNAGARGEIPVEFLNSNTLKDQLYALLGRETPGGGMMRFPSWAPNWLYTQLTSEERTSKGWENRSQRRNEAWDLSYYAIGLCLRPDIRLEHFDWTDEASLPAWAKSWDENALVIDPEGESPLVQVKAETIDLTQAAADFL